jgi:hypothetical protein
MQEFMSGLKGRVAIGVVGGSPEQHIFEQLGGSNEVFELYDYVFAENGLTGYMCGKPLPVQV